MANSNGVTNLGALTPETTAAMLQRAGFSFIPIKVDGSKAPLVEWKKYQKERPTKKDIDGWYGGGKTRGVSVIMGEVSGNAEMLELEFAHLVPEFCALVEEAAPGLIGRLVQQKSPKGGRHFIYRCSEIGKNTKLAMGAEEVADVDLPQTEGGDLDKREITKRGLRRINGKYYKVQVLAETRGEGGYFLAAGSPARCHPLNKPYELINLDFSQVQTITPQERAIPFAAARSFSKIPTYEREIAPERERTEREDGRLLPGTDYNARGDVRALLEAYGWTYVEPGAFGEMWRRPGKDFGHSATLFSDRNFWPFTTNAYPLEADVLYSPFALYTHLEHDRDFSKAASALAKAGYGDPLDKTKAKANSKPTNEGAQGSSVGNEASLDNEQGQATDAGTAEQSERTEEEHVDNEIPPLSLLDGKMRLEFRRAARGNVSIDGFFDGELVHQDEVYLSRDAHRARFVKRLAKVITLTEADQTAIENALLRKSKEVEKIVKEDRKTSAKKIFDPTETYTPYEIQDGKLIWLKPIIGSGEYDGLTQSITLTNFVAEIIGDVIRDDGTEPTQVFEVEVTILGEPSSHKGTVKAAEFCAMRWPVTVAGSGAVIYAGKVEHARCAVQLLSEKRITRRVVAHTGWRKDGDECRFYHGGGAIAASGLVQADVELPPALTPCVLPAPPTCARLREVVRAVAFDLPKVAPDRVMLPLLGCVFVAALTGGDFSLFLLGTTGKGKTELLILAQSFFGPRFDEKHIPANWGSTPYSIQGITHLAKDIVCGVDDFVPKGTQIEQAKLHAKAETVLRGQANSSGRARCNPDGSVRPERPPRGLIVATGEDIPRGQSLVARLLASEVKEGNVDWAQLTLCQKHRREGLYAEATSAFLQWLATDNRIEGLQKKAADKIHELRTGWSKTGLDIHKKVANTLAQIERAWGVWLEFAVECGAIGSDESDRIYGAVMDALDAAGREQARFLANENPATRFIELLRAAIQSGRAHLASATDEGAPSDASAWGWRDAEVPTLSGPRTEWRGLGDRIGWIEGDAVYLQPDASSKIAQSMGVNGEGLTISTQTLWKRLKEEGLISTEASRESNKVRKTINGRSETVIQIKCNFFFPGATPQVGKT